MKKIDIEISNMLRIESAKLTLQPGKITTVSGPNEAGKTSIATLVGAILSRSDNPLLISAELRPELCRYRCG